MPSLYAEIEIDAPRSVVWRALMQKENWLYWNTFLFDRTPDRPFKQGDRLLLSLKRIASEAETEVEPLITLVQPNVCLRWVYKAPGFESEHVFELQDIGRNRTKYTHRENLSGVVVRFTLPFIRQDEQEGLRRMARELKRYVEQRMT
ncbi:MAG TPA: SRPBCC domain-containing protein [Synechococcales cyanobacterium M55_K2018_004]|nr:SRPBCC domain-containing protein [Synechococcales cyanobacterium M55_K2018_004]